MEVLFSLNPNFSVVTSHNTRLYFNTTSVFIKQSERMFRLALDSISIQLLFLLNILDYLAEMPRTNFNTTSVFIKLNRILYNVNLEIHFNTTSVFIKRLIKPRWVHMVFISIQLLFLLNKEYAEKIAKALGFQYNFCFY